MGLFPPKDKLYYSIGEVQEITGVEQHVLRYWETNFSSLKPRKSRSGQRNYTKEDIEIIKMISQLLYDEGFSIKGANNKLKEILASRKKKPGKKAAESKPKASAKSQLVFGAIEKETGIQMNEKAFLENISKKLTELGKRLQEIKQL